MNPSKFNVMFRIALIAAFAAFAGCSRIKTRTDEMTDEKVVCIRTSAKGWMWIKQLDIKLTASPKNEKAVNFKNIEICLIDNVVGFTAERQEVRVRFDKGDAVAFTCKRDHSRPIAICFDNPEMFFRQCINASALLVQYENGFGSVKTVKFDVSDLPAIIYGAGIRSIGGCSGLEVASN